MLKTLSAKGLQDNRLHALGCAEWLQHFCTVGTATAIHVDLRPHTERELSALAWLDAEERGRWRGYLHLGARRAFSLCRAALRIILCERLACQNEQLAFITVQHGKPFATVDGTPAVISFNISHSGNHGLIALAPAGRLGVDVEEYVARRYLDKLATSATVFAAHEREALARVSGDDKVRLFARLWTIKEALAKAIGTGFSIAIAALEVPPALFQGTTSTFQFAHEPAAQWQVEYVGNDEFAAAVVQEIV